MDNCEPKEVGEINCESQLCERERRFERSVFAGPPRLRFAFDAVLGRSREIGFVIEESFEHGARVVERETNAEGDQTWQKKNFLHPSSRMEFTLGAKIKHRDRSRCRDENRDVDQKGPKPAAIGSPSRGMQEDA